MAQRFDANRLAVIGQPFPFATFTRSRSLQRLESSPRPTAGSSHTRVKQAQVSQLTWFDCAGRAMEQIGEPAAFTGVSVRRRPPVRGRDTDGPGVEQDIWRPTVSRAVVALA